MSSPLPLVLLHGWGFSSRVWQPLIKHLHNAWPGPVCTMDLPGFGTAYHEHCHSLDDVLHTILAQLPPRCVLCGWSLGGMLATQLAVRWPARVQGLVTIASNLHFTQQGDWPGMPAGDYQQFCERFELQPEKTWRRFLTQQTRGETSADRHTATLTMLSDYEDMDPDTAATLLKLLGTIDNRSTFAALTVPGMHCLGENDAITPAAIADYLSTLNARQSVYVLPEASHALCITRSQDIAQRLLMFSKRILAAQTITDSAAKTSATARAATPLVISQKKIAQSFSQAASRYDQAAHLQRAIGEKLLSHITPVQCTLAADVGCGTGFITRTLQARSEHTVAVDIATGMLQATRASCGPTVSVVQADMMHLPLPAHALSMLTSNLALQWSHHPAQVFKEWRRVLTDGGELHFSTFIPGTLRELQQAWRAVDHHVHVNPFVCADDLITWLHDAGFTSISAEQETRVCHYPDIRTLAHELKSIGAHNMNADQPHGLTGKSRWQQLQTAYELFRCTDGLPASYEVLYVSAY